MENREKDHTVADIETVAVCTEQACAQRDEALCRTRMLLGAAAMERLLRAHVIVFGIGGVGGHAAEALVRSGIGKLTLVDNDTVAASNLNRQLVATRDALGRLKIEVLRERLLSIRPDCVIETIPCFYLPETAAQFELTQYDYIIDAIDTVTAKLELITRAAAGGVPIISSMGAGNKLDPTRFVVTDIYQTSVCPLARVMRRELKKRGIASLKVVYSTEEARKPFVVANETPQEQRRRAVAGSVAFVPAVAGLILAGEVVRAIAEV